MPDYYNGALTITAFPSYPVTLEEIAGEGGLRWNQAEIDFYAIAATLADELREAWWTSAPRSAGRRCG